MPHDTFGLSFSPLTTDRSQPWSRPGEAPPTGGPLQEAIQTLSLRLPRASGAQGLAPGPLLASAGAGGLGASGLSLQQLLQRLFGGLRGPVAAGHAPMMGPGGGLPLGVGAALPRIIPGGQPGAGAALPTAPPSMMPVGPMGAMPDQGSAGAQGLVPNLAAYFGVR